MKPRLLIAGIGNVFLGDDAFGVHVVRRLAGPALPDSVCVRDYGIRGLDLAFALSAGYEGAVLVDATSRGSPPGTLYVIEPCVDDAPAEYLVETHNMDPVTVLRLAQAMGARLPWLRLVGCEPATVDEGMELSRIVEARIDGAVELIEGLVSEFFAGVEATRP